MFDVGGELSQVVLEQGHSPCVRNTQSLGHSAHRKVSVICVTKEKL